MTAPALYAFLQQPAEPAEPGQQAQAPIDPLFNIFVWFVVPIFFLYLLIIRPTQRQEKQRRELLSQLKRNDEVVFAGGIIGKVVDIKEKPGGVSGEEDVIIVRVDDKTRFSILRSAISRVASANANAKDPGG